MEKNFYEQLKSFNQFEDFHKEEHYTSVPDDWHVVITDVSGSTRAIEEGRYRDVNTLGAATIVAAKAAMDREDFPFVFGGDGSTMIIPSSKINRILSELKKLKKMAKQNFSLDLRIGSCEVSRIKEQGKSLRLAKYSLVGGPGIAIFQGDGLGHVETLLKTNQLPVDVSSEDAGGPDLEGLSCRWNPIPAKRGVILSLLILSRLSGNSAYDKILKELKAILPEGIEAHNPVDTVQMTYKSFSQCLRDEWRYHHSFSFDLVKRVLEIVLSQLIFKLHIPPLFFDSKKYTQSMRTHSDFRKFDEVMRLTIDCSPQQAKQIGELLERHHREGEVFYGLFETKESIMTCFVNGLNDGEHIHFIDASNGGYAKAALQLKKQMKESIT